MSLEAKLSSSVKEAITQLYGEAISSEIIFQATRKEFEGSHTLVVFPYTKLSKGSPEATGTAIGEYLLKNEPLIAKFNVVKGFLNLTISDAYWIESIKTICNHKTIGQLASKNKKV